MTLADLPEIQITHHARATRLRLRVEPTQIRLTVPKFCSKRQIQDFLNQSEQWMVETWQKQQASLLQIAQTLPIELRLFNRQNALTVSYKTQKNEIELTYTEFEILLLLAQNAGIVFSKEQIYDSVWEEPYFGDYNIVMSHIRNIREKIEDNPSKPIYIQTVWGVGYRFNKNGR